MIMKLAALAWLLGHGRAWYHFELDTNSSNPLPAPWEQCPDGFMVSTS
jgi:hypothetical protein